MSFHLYVNLMAGHRCPIIHWLNLNARVNIKNGQLNAIKAGSRLSQRLVHALMFKVGFYFRPLTTTKPIRCCYDTVDDDSYSILELIHKYIKKGKSPVTLKSRRLTLVTRTSAIHTTEL